MIDDTVVRAVVGTAALGHKVRPRAVVCVLSCWRVFRNVPNREGENTVPDYSEHTPFTVPGKPACAQHRS